MKKLLTRALVVWVFLGPLVGFILGPGFIWHWKMTTIESERLDHENAKAALEIRKEMIATLDEIIKLDPKSPIRQGKIDYYNAAEKNLARYEGRPAIVYSFALPAPPSTLSLKPRQS